MLLLIRYRSFKQAMCSVLALIFVFTFSSNAGARVKTQKISISAESGAKIYVNGTLIGSNPTEIKVLAFSSSNVRVEKIGYITEERNYINDEQHQLPKSDFIKLQKDDAYENSFTTDIANRDIEIRTSLKEDDAWKLISRIITSTFDVIEVTDKSTGYMRTAWSVKNFKSATIRTRLIIKTGNSDPLTYKAKLISEYGKPGATASQDEMFQTWDRVLRTFENIIPELQSRVAK